jgi:CheY-like chemotaxis protein
LVEFNSGKELLRYLEQLENQNVDVEDFEHETPSMIFLDLLMPGMDGIKTLKAIRAQPLWADIPVTLITHSHEEARIERAQELGANAFMPKPFTKLDVAHALKHTNNYSAMIL